MSNRSHGIFDDPPPSPPARARAYPISTHEYDTVLNTHDRSSPYPPSPVAAPTWAAADDRACEFSSHTHWDSSDASWSMSRSDIDSPSDAAAVVSSSTESPRSVVDPPPFSSPPPSSPPASPSNGKSSRSSQTTAANAC